MGRILAIDYGLKRCGIAVTDPLRIIAQPYDTIERDQILAFLRKYIPEEDVDVIVLGMPYKLDGSLGEMAHEVLNFRAQIEKRYPKMEIHEIDERFTSKSAQRIVVQAVKSKKKRANKGLIDKVSASLILESFMNKNKLI